VSQAMLNQNISEEDAAVHLNASDHLRKEMGVYQHHDAVAGTAK
jgi:hypothetical protein